MSQKNLDANWHFHDKFIQELILYRCKGAPVDGVIWYRITIKGTNGGRIQKSAGYRDLTDAVFSVEKSTVNIKPVNVKISQFLQRISKAFVMLISKIWNMKIRFVQREPLTPSLLWLGG
jgi:hypothetical protein